MTRLLLFLLRSTLVFILLLNVSFKQSCDNSTLKQIQIPGGVLPLKPWFLETYVPVLRWVTLLTFGALRNGANINSPTVFIPTNVECPPAHNQIDCRSFYMLQNLQIGLSDLNWTNETGFMTLSNAPIYDLVIEWLQLSVAPGPDTFCRSYQSQGWPFQLILCARADNQNNETYIMMSKYELEMIVILGSGSALRQRYHASVGRLL